jgi:hypothetical protein
VIEVNTFDSFLKERLGFLKGGYDRFEFSDLKPAIDHASVLGFFELNASDESFSLLCSLLKKSIGFDGGFALSVFTQAIVSGVFRSAGFEKPLAGQWLASQPFQGLPQNDGLKGINENGQYFLQGTARMVALGREAQQGLFCAVGKDDRFSFFLTDLSETQKPERVLVLGMRTLPFYDLQFDKKKAILVGEEGSGATHFSNMARPLRVAACAMMFGLLESAYREALLYAQERVQGGRKIIEWSEHKMMLSRVFGRLKTGENLLAYCLGKSDGITDSESISTLVYFQECLAEMTSSSVQAMGGAGYMKDYPLERFYRDAHQLRCLFGTAPFHRLELFSREGTNV